MPQRIYGIGLHQLSDKVQDPADVRPLDRIKFFVSKWERMNWYVDFAQKNLDRLSPGEVLNYQEDVVALERTLFKIHKPAPPDLPEIKGMQESIRKHLESLADKGVAVFIKPASITTIVAPKVVARQEGITLKPGDAIIADIFYWDGYPGVRGLVHYLAELLKQFAPSIKRCPHCSKIFLQLRRNAVYCSRQCQSVAGMRAIRARKKQKKAGSKRAHLKGSRAQRKESKHG